MNSDEDFVRGQTQQNEGKKFKKIFDNCYSDAEGRWLSITQLLFSFSQLKRTDRERMKTLN